MMRTRAIWLIERSCELIAGALIAIAIFGPSNPPVGDTPLGQLKIGVAGVGVFYVASGYVISAVAFGLFAHRQQPITHGALMGGLFLAHSLFFFLYVTGGTPVPVALVAAGAAAVFLINAAGTAALKVVGHRRYER